MSKFFEYVSYERERPEKGSTIFYSELKPTNSLDDEETLYVVPELLSGGDCASTGTVEISNHRVFLEKFEAKDGVHDVSGGYGSFGVAIRKDVYESDEDIQSVLQALEDYPVCDDEDLSELELTKSQAAWDDWGRSEAERYLRNSLESLLGDPDRFEAIEEDLLHLFNDASDESCTYWQSESGGTMYIDMARVLPYLRDQALVRVLEEEELPLLVSHKWVSDRAKNKYIERMKHGTSR